MSRIFLIFLYHPVELAIFRILIITLKKLFTFVELTDFMYTHPFPSNHDWGWEHGDAEAICNLGQDQSR